MAFGIFKWLFGRSFRHRFSKVLNHFTLDEYNTSIIKNRYIPEVQFVEREYRRNTFLFMTLTNVITFGGVLLIMFLTLQNVVSDCQCTNWVFWTCLVLATIVTLANKLLYVFGIPRRYILDNIVMEKLYSEGWQFLSGIGNYAIEDHKERCMKFLTRVEKIKMKTVEKHATIASGGQEQLNDLVAMAPQSLTAMQNGTTPPSWDPPETQSDDSGDRKPHARKSHSSKPQKHKNNDGKESPNDNIGDDFTDLELGLPSVGVTPAPAPSPEPEDDNLIQTATS